ncbi:hypothetical protein GGI42DRAFT_238314 [Trichoderma sp. SZMC 28013]
MAASANLHHLRCCFVGVLLLPITVLCLAAPDALRVRPVSFSGIDTTFSPLRPVDLTSPPSTTNYLPSLASALLSRDEAPYPFGRCLGEPAVICENRPKRPIGKTQSACVFRPINRACFTGFDAENALPFSVRLCTAASSQQLGPVRATHHSTAAMRLAGSSLDQD